MAALKPTLRMSSGADAGARATAPRMAARMAAIDLVRVLLGNARRGRAQRILDGVVAFHLAIEVEDHRLGAGGADIHADDVS